MTVELYLAGIILAALVAYALLGGADFGGGVWDLLATGPRADDQRKLIESAIGPIWEANHVWLIAILVLLFSCFPLAYAALATALHLPFTIMLLGIVLRGSAFVFRSYDARREEVFRAWSRVFAVSSVIAPLMLGISLGAAASGRIRVDPTGRVTNGLVDGWWAPFPVAVGVFVVAVFAFLAAVYLAHETDDDELAEAFRTRALLSAVAVTGLAWVVFLLAADGAPRLRAGLWSSWWAPSFQLGTAALGLGVIHGLWTRRYGRARLLAMVQVTALVCGFGAAQFPMLITPDVSLYSAAAPATVTRLVAITMTVGLIALLPAYLWLVRVFKT